MENMQTDIFAALKVETHTILGRVLTLNFCGLVFQSISDRDIPLKSIQHLDVFTTGQLYLKDLPVKVISDHRILDERSFSKMITRKIKVSFDIMLSELFDIQSQVRYLNTHSVELENIRNSV